MPLVCVRQDLLGGCTLTTHAGPPFAGALPFAVGVAALTDEFRRVIARAGIVSEPAEEPAPAGEPRGLPEAELGGEEAGEVGQLRQGRIGAVPRLAADAEMPRGGVSAIERPGEECGPVVVVLVWFLVVARGEPCPEVGVHPHGIRWAVVDVLFFVFSGVDVLNLRAFKEPAALQGQVEGHPVFEVVPFCQLVEEGQATDVPRGEFLVGIPQVEESGGDLVSVVLVVVERIALIAVGQSAEPRPLRVGVLRKRARKWPVPRCDDVPDGERRLLHFGLAGPLAYGDMPDIPQNTTKLVPGKAFLATVPKAAVPMRCAGDGEWA